LKQRPNKSKTGRKLESKKNARPESTRRANDTAVATPQMVLPFYRARRHAAAVIGNGVMVCF
jgi:hypothetical protein